MAAGVLIGRFLPAVPQFLGRFEYAQVSIPIAILIWLMIYPMMMKVDFASIRYIGKKSQGLVCDLGNKLADQAVHNVRHRLVLPVLSSSSPGSRLTLPKSYLAGAILLGRGALHRHGLRLELPDQGQRRLYGCPGRDQ